MMNRSVLVGRLTKDPELRYTQSGIPVATFTLAVNRNFKNQNGESEADFISIVVWRKAAENCANYLHKGSLAGVDGRIQTRNFEGQDGKTVYVTEVVAESVQFLEPKKSNNNQSNNTNNNNNAGNNGYNNNNNGYNQNQNYNQGNNNQGNYNQGNNNQGNYNQGNNNQGNYNQGNNNNNPFDSGGGGNYNDPFANSGTPIEISDDDLPF